MPSDKKMQVGTVSWFDIPVEDFEKAKSFYGELFGWNFVPFEDNYMMIQNGEDMIGGLRSAMGPRVEADSPAFYITVKEIDESTPLAKRLGATLVGEKVIVGDNEGAFQLFRDPDKNLIAMFSEL